MPVLCWLCACLYTNFNFLPERINNKNKQKPIFLSLKDVIDLESGEKLG
jgi:hypothetical protein